MQQYLQAADQLVREAMETPHKMQLARLASEKVTLSLSLSLFFTMSIPNVTASTATQ